MTYWQPIATMPYGIVCLVKNDIMEKPVRATRGFVLNGAVHADQSFCTSVFTPDPEFSYPAGHLVCPSLWTPIDDGAE